MLPRDCFGALIGILIVSAIGDSTSIQTRPNPYSRHSRPSKPAVTNTNDGRQVFLQDGLWWPKVTERAEPPFEYNSRRLRRRSSQESWREEPHWLLPELDELPQSSSNNNNQHPQHHHQHQHHNQAMRNKEQPNYRTTTACEGNLMELSCEDGKLIHLVRANYGRFSLTICNEFGYSNYSTQCASFRSFLHMETRCNNLTTCNVTVSKDLFGDPCEGTAKYLEVQYHCNDVNSQSNNRQPTSSANPVISTNSSARQPQVTAAPPNDHKSHSSTNHNNVVGGNSNLPSVATSTTTATLKLDSSGNHNSNDAVGSDPSSGQPPVRPPGGGYADPDTLDHQPQQTVIQTQQYCLPQASSRNLFWNYTRAGQVATQPCPDGSSGRSVKWLCDYERLRFVPVLSPDFSQCRSNWLARLNQQLNQMLEIPSSRQQLSPSARQQDEQTIRSILGELSLLTKTKELFGEDLKRIDIMINQMIAQLRSTANLSGGNSMSQTQTPLVNIYSDLFGKVTSICSSLFDSLQRQAWLELPAHSRRHLEERLLSHLKEAGLMFAQSLTPGQLAETQPIRQTNVLAGISVIINNQLKPTTATPASQLDKSPSNELDLLARSFDDNNAPLLSSEESSTDFRLQPQLLAELAADGIIKFLTLDIKMPNYPLTMMQLEQQIAATQEQAVRGLPLVGDFSQNLAGDQNQFQKRIFGVFAINGETGELVDVAPPTRNQQDSLAPFSMRHRDTVKQRLGELLAQWPISVEFKSPKHVASTGGVTTPQLQSMRQCQSLAVDSPAAITDAVDAQANMAATNRCHLSKHNSTNFVCSCDRFGYVVLAHQVQNLLANSQSFGPNGPVTGIQDDHIQWPPSSVSSGLPMSGNQMHGGYQNEPARNYEGPYVFDTPQQTQSHGALTYTFVVIGVGLLVLSFVGLVINVILRITGRSNRKHQSFLDSLRDGPTTGPLTADHNLMGSNPLVSGAATTQSGSIIGLATGANSGPMGQICSGSAAAGNSAYKTHQQLYAAHMGTHSSPMMEAYASSEAPRGWPAKLTNWLIERPAGWLSNLTSSGVNGSSKSDRMIQHRIVGSNASTIGTLAYQKSQYQNGYTTTPGIHNTVQQHHTLARNYLSSSGNGSQSGMPLNPSSNSSYVSSSAYYEEIGSGNLTKVNASQLTGFNHTMGNNQNILDPFMVKQRQQYMENHSHQQHTISNGHNIPQQQQVFHTWQTATPSNGNTATSYPSQNGPGIGQQQHQRQQPMSLITKQHLHNDLSPLQSSSSSSAGSQHSNSAAPSNLTNGTANGSNGTTPRHFLFASPIAVNAYKQQQQQQFRSSHQRHDHSDR